MAATAMPCARSGHGEGAARGKIGFRLTGKQRSLRGQRAAPLGEHQPRHGARRLHLERSGQATSTNTTKPTARTTATAPTASAPGNCGVEGPSDDPAVNTLRMPAKAKPAGHFASVAGNADARGGRRVRPHAKWKQQRLLPGQPHELGRWPMAARGSRISYEFTSAASHPPRAPRASNARSSSSREIHGGAIWPDRRGFVTTGNRCRQGDWNDPASTVSRPSSIAARDQRWRRKQWAPGSFQSRSDTVARRDEATPDRANRSRGYRVLEDFER